MSSETLTSTNNSHAWITAIISITFIPYTNLFFNLGRGPSGLLGFRKSPPKADVPPSQMFSKTPFFIYIPGAIATFDVGLCGLSDCDAHATCLKSFGFLILENVKYSTWIIFSACQICVRGGFIINNNRENISKGIIVENKNKTRVFRRPTQI